MSDYTQALIRLQDALANGYLTQREYELGAVQVRREHSRLGWGGGDYDA